MGDGAARTNINEMKKKLTHPREAVVLATLSSPASCQLTAVDPTVACQGVEAGYPEPYISWHTQIQRLRLQKS